jgi:hypothetical protein
MAAHQAVAPAPQAPSTERYARIVESSKRLRFDIDTDVIRGRSFEFSKKFLPDGLSKARELAFLGERERTLFSQVQGRTYANLFGLVERFIAPKMLEVSREHWFGDQNAFEALVRFTDEELKHQELFRRVESMLARGMPAGYTLMPRANDVAGVVLGKSTWAVLGLICHIEIFVLAHYREAIEPDAGLSALWKDIFTFHAREESQHAIIDELEWRREDAGLSAEQRDRAVDELIGLVAAVDGILKTQAAADTDYFLRECGRSFGRAEAERIGETMLKAYRWQYIGSGVQDERFRKILGGMASESQVQRIAAALGPILA